MGRPLFSAFANCGPDFDLKQGVAVDDNSKMGLTVLALLTAVIYASANAMSMDMSVADAVLQLVQLGTDLLRRLLY